MNRNIRIFFLVLILISVSAIYLYQPDIYLCWSGTEDRLEELINKYKDARPPIVITSDAGERYNIVLILTDDQPKGTVQYMPSLLDRIGSGGVVFDNAFLSNPVCSPSRASILSGGFHSRDTGVKTNGRFNGSMHNFDETKTLATYLNAAGYATGFVGKYIHGYVPGYVPPGWNHFVANENGGMLNDYWNIGNVTYGSSNTTAARGEVKYSKAPKREYITNFQTNEAIDFLEKYAAQPFFLLLSYYAPHNPFITESSEDDSFAAQIPYSCIEDENYSDKPSWVKVVAKELKQENNVDCGQTGFAVQVALLQSVDRGIASIFDKLTHLDILEKTVVIFMSDNGIARGRSNFYQDKGMPYEGSIRVPLIIFFPSIPKGVNTDLVAANLDVPATIFNIAGVQGPTDGLSLLDVSNRIRSLDRKFLLIENYGYLKWHVGHHGHPLPPVIWSGLRTPEWKYVEYTTGDRELYNVSTDTNETANVIDQSAYRKIVQELAEILRTQKGLAISTIELPHGLVGQNYSVLLKPWGGTPPYRWRILDTRLPAGLVLDGATGEISGTPVESGKIKVRIEVEDSGNAKHSNLPEKFSWEFELWVCDRQDECFQEG